MATSVLDQYRLGPTEQAKSLAKIKLDNSFSAKAQNAFNFFSSEIVPYITDYFVLSDDLRTRVGMDEEYRRCYHDYSFLVFPVHKAFESFLAGVWTFVFQFKVSRAKKETIGHYLKFYPEEDRKAKIDMLTKRFPKIVKTKWLERWQALGQCWTDNRNPFIHPEQKIPTFRIAEQITSVILSETRLSVEIIMIDIFNPLLEEVEKERVEKDKLAKIEGS